MKKILSMILTVVMCLAIACPVFAAGENFVESIGGKDHPPIVPVPGENGVIGLILDGDEIIDYVYEDCLIITPVSKAESSTEIPSHSRDVLLDVYAALSDGSMKLPYEKVSADIDPNAMVIRDLFDATFVCAEHPEMLEPEGILLQLTFDVGVAPEDEVIVMTYKNDEWNPIVSVTNNGDGTVTCLFEKLCPVSFSVEGMPGSPSTGDTNGSAIQMWTILLVVSVVAMSALIIASHKKHTN